MSGAVDGQFNIGGAINGIAQMGQMGFQNALMAQQRTQNQIAIQNAQAKQAAGLDFQKAIDPATGQFNPAKYNQLLAADPAAAFAAQDSSQAGVTNQSGVLSNQAQQISNKTAQLGFLANLSTGYAENPPSMKQAQSDLANGIAQGLIDPSVGAQILSTAPTDPQQAKAWWANEAQHLSAAHGEIARFLPNATPISAGGSTIIGNNNPLSNGYTAPGTVVTNSPSPEFMSTPLTVKTSTGDQTGTPLQLGLPIPQASITPAGATPAVFGPRGLAPIGNPSGGAPASPQPATPTGTPTQPNASGTNAGPLANGPIFVPAGSADAAAGLAKDQTAAYSQDVQTATNSAPVMSSIYELGSAARGFSPGPMASNIAAANSLFQEMGLPVATDATAAEQTAAKASGMLMAQNLTNVGSNTDAGLGAALGITPNGTMSAQGLAATAAMTAGAKLYQLRLGQAAQAWEAQGNVPSDPKNGYNAFKLKFSSQTSPLVMALPFMPPSQIQEVAKYVKTLPGDQQRMINNQIKISRANGWLNVAPAQQ